MVSPCLPFRRKMAQLCLCTKNREQNIECSFSCVARSAVLLKSNVANILPFNFYEKKKFVQNGPITIAIDCNGLSLLAFSKKNGPIMPSGPKSAPNSDLFCVRRLLNVCERVFCAPNATILLVYIAAKIKMSFSFGKMIFFCQNRHLL